MCPYRTPEERETDYAHRQARATFLINQQAEVAKWRAESKIFESEILQSINIQSHASSAALKQIALERLTKRLKSTEQANLYFNTMSDILKYHSRITINFDFKIFVAHYNPETQRLKNAFDFITNPQHKSFDGYYAVDPQKRPFGYLQWRDKAETALFRLPIHQKTYLRTHHPDHICLSSILTQRNFFASTRPIYGALDFIKSSNGGASTYGRSFIVLRPNYKKLSTYTPSDSIYLAATPQSIASFDCLENIIGLLEPDHFFTKGNLFSILFEMARDRIVGGDLPHTASQKTDYIEAQIHAKDLDYSECIAEIYIDKEMYERIVQEPNLFTDDCEKRLIVKTHQVINDIRDFCRANSIGFYFV